jgi:outer membrane receptor protein involved in Fe transport
VRALFEPVDRLRVSASYWKYDGNYPSGAYATDAGFAPQAGPLLDALPAYTVKGISAAYGFDDIDVFYGYASNRYALPLSGKLNNAVLDSDIGIGVTTHELRLSSNGHAPWRWTGGFYWRASERDDAWNYPGEDIDQRSTTTSRAMSVYGDVTWTLPWLPLESSIGLRHFRDHLTGHDSNHGIAARPDDAVFSSNSPRLSLSWRPRDGWQLYASASKGFRSGQRQVTGFEQVAAATGVSFPSVIAPDTIWTYELGTKIAALDRRLDMEFAVYHNDWKDVAVRIPLGATGLNALVNSPGTRTDGFDATAAFTWTRSLKTAVGMSVVAARYTGSVPGTGIRRGAAADDVPRLLASANVEYDFPDVAGWKTSARAGMQHASPHRSAVFPDYTAGDTINNVNARLSFGKRPWTLALYGENLMNDRGATSVRSVIPLTTTASEAYSPRLRPCTIGIELVVATD